MYLALKEKTIKNSWPTILSFIVFIMGNFNDFFWILSAPAFTILTLTTLPKALSHLNKEGATYRILTYYGRISFYLFLVNGFIRYPFHQISTAIYFPYADDILCLLSLLVSTFAAEALHYVEIQLINLYNRRSKTI